MVRTDPKFEQLYAAHYAKLIVFACLAGNQPPKTRLTDRMTMPKEELFKSEFYDGFMRRQDVHTLLSVYLLSEGTVGTRIALGRSPRAGEWDQRHIERLRLLAPNLHHAALANRRLESCQLVTEGALAALNRLTQGVVIVDNQGRVLFVNLAGERMLAEADGLAIKNSERSIANRGQGTTLRRLITQAAGGQADQAFGEISGPSRDSLIAQAASSVGAAHWELRRQAAPA